MSPSTPRHAGEMLIEMHADEVVLAIADDGRGFDPRERLSHSKRWA